MPEPGFYYGAMYLSYAYYVAVILLFIIVGLNWIEMDITVMLAWMVPVIIILTPLFFRWARRTYLTMFVSYEPKKGSTVAVTDHPDNLQES